jgi:hypothetical protein
MAAVKPLGPACTQTSPTRGNPHPPGRSAGPGMGSGTGHLLHLWSAATRQALYPDIDERIKARLTDSEACRYELEHSRQALQQRLRARRGGSAGRQP